MAGLLPAVIIIIPDCIQFAHNVKIKREINRTTLSIHNW
jgi:hypothetical protein